MGFFKKEVKESNSKINLPDLPELPELPPLPDLEDKDNFSIPPVPNSNMQEKSNMPEMTEEQAIKTNVLSKTQDMPNKERRTIEISESPDFMPRQAYISKEPVYVKLDKFKEALKNFEAIKTKIREIEGSLKKVKEVKEREEQEMKEWEQELQLIKSRVDTIDHLLFSRLNA